MAGTEETRIGHAADLVLQARDLACEDGSHRLLTLMDMAVIELAKEIERLVRREQAREPLERRGSRVIAGVDAAAPRFAVRVRQSQRCELWGLRGEPASVAG